MPQHLPASITGPLRALGVGVLHTVERAFARTPGALRSDAAAEALELACEFPAPETMSARLQRIDLMRLERQWAFPPSRRPDHMRIRITHRDGARSHAPADLALLLGPGHAMEDADALALRPGPGAPQDSAVHHFLQGAAEASEAPEDADPAARAAWVARSARELIESAAQPAPATPEPRSDTIASVADAGSVRLHAADSAEAAALMLPNGWGDGECRTVVSTDPHAPEARSAPWQDRAGITLECLETLDLSEHDCRFLFAGQVPAGRYRVLHLARGPHCAHPTIGLFATRDAARGAFALSVSPASGAWRVHVDARASPQHEAAALLPHFLAAPEGCEIAAGALHLLPHDEGDLPSATLRPREREALHLHLERTPRGRLTVSTAS